MIEAVTVQNIKSSRNYGYNQLQLDQLASILDELYFVGMETQMFGTFRTLTFSRTKKLKYLAN